MKKVYFAGTFSLSVDQDLPLSTRLSEDYRAKLLGNAELMINFAPNILLQLSPEQTCQYIGPFYCEEAVAGYFTSTDCEVVVMREREQVETSDLVVCLLDSWPSIGSTVELEWAIELKKDILILYEIEESEYTLPSGLWFVIQDVILRGKNVKILGYNKGEFELKILKDLLIAYCENGLNKEK